MFRFYNSMNILSINLNPYTPSFCARGKTPKIKMQMPLTSDIIELSHQLVAPLRSLPDKPEIIKIMPQLPDVLPKKFEFTPLEAKYNEVMVELLRLDLNIRTQKQNLRSYYSSQDKFDYQQLLAKRRKVAAQLKRIAKNAGWDQYDLEHNIDVKKQYNRISPKIYKAQSLAELEQAESLINQEHYKIPQRTAELLFQLIEQRKKIIT